LAEVKHYFAIIR